MQSGQEQTKEVQQVRNQGHGTEHATSWCAVGNSKVEICKTSTLLTSRPLPNQDGSELEAGWHGQEEKQVLLWSNTQLLLAVPPLSSWHKV